jgi:lactate permease
MQLPLEAPTLFIGGADALLALLPIAAVVGLMLAGQSAARAGGAGMLLALLIAWSPAFGGTFADDDGRLRSTLAVIAEAGFTAATILWIVFAALCVYYLQEISGAIVTIRDRLASLAADPRMVALLVAWFFALFMEGAAGFGTPVALAAPLLVGLGFRPVEAVAISLLGHAVGVSFGAVGTPVIPQVAATGLDAVEISRAVATLHGLLGWFMVVALVYVAGRAASDRGAGHVWGWSLFAAAAFLVPYLLIAWAVGPELPTLLGALVGGAVFVLFLRRSKTHSAAAAAREPSEASARDGDQPGILRSASPYLFLIGLVLATRLIPPVEDAARAVTIDWNISDRFAGSFQPFYHPGTLLLLAFMLAGPAQRQEFSVFRRSVVSAAKRLAPVSIALFATLCVARLMVHSGMIEELAAASATLLGAGWPLAAPLVGVLGTFATGSATSSNILFTEFQASTADQPDLPLEPMIGAQGFGAAAGNVIAPHNIVAGGATVGLKGQEGAVLRWTALPCLVYAIFGGILTFILTR